MDIRVGVIGTGVMGRDHVRRLANVVHGATVTAVCDANRDRAQQVAGRHGLVVYDHAEQLIGSAEVDAVVIASPDESHAQLTRQCIAAGKPVLCEKPLAASAQDALAVIADEQAYGARLVQVGFMRRYDPGYVQLHETILHGDLGVPLMIHCAHRNKTRAPGHTSAMTITNSGIHEIDVLRWLTGAEYVRGQTLAVRQNRHVDASLTDPQFFVLTTDTGVLCDVEVNQSSGYGYDIRCEVVCEEGTISLATPHDVRARRAGVSGQPVQQHWTERFVTAYDRQFQDWVDHARQGTAGGASAWDGYVASAVAAYLVTDDAAQPDRVVPLAPRPRFYEEERS